MGGGHEEVPRYVDADQDAEPPKNKVGVTAYGKISDGPTYTMYGFDTSIVEDYPKELHPLDKMRWFNYSKLNDDRPRYPLIAKSVSDNRRIWQEMELDRMLDHTPPHEIHASDLPDYHYFPSIQNELNEPRRGLAANVIYDGHKSPHHQPQSWVPRFFRTGIPKTPIQEQNWYIPLNSDGRFNWRANIDKNGYTGSYFSKEGFNRRFEANVRKAKLPTEHLGFLHFSTHPNWFRLNELNFLTRVGRMLKGSNMNFYWINFVFYAGLLVSFSLGDTNFRRMQWDHEPANPDVSYISNIREIGGFHGLV